MKMSLSRVRSVVLVAVAGAAIGTAGSAKGFQPADDAPKPTTLFSIEHLGLKSFLVDRKDQALKNAMEMIPARLAELPNEFPMAQAEQVQAGNFVLKQFSRPARFGIIYNGGNPSGGAFGYGVVMSTLSDEEGIQMMSQLVDMGVGQAGEQVAPQASETHKGMSEFWLPFGLFTYGPRQAKDGWRYEVMFGSVDDAEAAFSTMPSGMLGGDTQTAIRGTFDLSALTPAATFAQSAAGRDNPQLGPIVQQATKAGLVGANALKGEMEFGFSSTHARAKVQVHNAQKLREPLGIPQKGLSSDDLKVIPSDALFATAWAGEWTMLLSAMDTASQANPEFSQGMSQVESATGVNLRDLISTLGGTQIVYASDATGGNSLFSLVAMTTVRDRQSFLGMHEKLRGFVNEQSDNADDEAMRGRFKIIPWSDSGTPGTQLYSARINGLPLPVEITYAVTDKWVIAGFMPQSVVAAARQALGKGDQGLMSRNDVLPKGAGAKPMVYFSFADTPRVMGDGYPIVCLFGSAVANGVRPMSGERDPGMIVPTFKELRDGAKPYTTWVNWDGDDLVMEASADRSMLVNASGLLGMVWKVAPYLAIPALGARQSQMMMPADFPMPEPEGDEQGALPGGAKTSGALAQKALESVFLNVFAGLRDPASVASSLEPSWSVLSPLKVGAMMEELAAKKSQKSQKSQ